MCHSAGDSIPKRTIFCLFRARDTQQPLRGLPGVQEQTNDCPFSVNEDKTLRLDLGKPGSENSTSIRSFDRASKLVKFLLPGKGSLKI